MQIYITRLIEGEYYVAYAAGLGSVHIATVATLEEAEAIKRKYPPYLPLDYFNWLTHSKWK